MHEHLRLDVDDDTLREALTEANPPALLAALVHLTGDPDLLRADLRPQPGHLREPEAGFTAEQLAELRALAFSVLSSYRGDGRDLPPPPDEATITRTMNFCTGENIPQEYVPMMLGEMSLAANDTYGIEWHHRPSAEALAGFRVLIIGAGMSGICAAIRLQEAGIPYIVVEKNARVGGTWLENTYPGCRVDVQNHFYSYSFEPNHDWPEYYSRRADLQGYFEGCADKYAVREHIRFETEVVSARYDAEAKGWTIHLRQADGSEYDLKANAIISSVGQLNRPKMPGLRGLESFEGPTFHSARWEHQHDLTGKRVAVVGTGASAMQFAPELAEQVERLVIFQRSPNWANYSAEYAKQVSDNKKWLLKNVPYYSKWYRFILFWRTSDGAYPALQVDPEWPHPERSLNAANDMMRQRVRHALHLFLRGATHTRSLSHRRNAHRQTRERAACHAKNVCIEVMCVKNIDARRLQPAHKTSQLSDSVLIGEAVQRKGGNLAEVEVVDAIAQDAFRTETRELYFEPAAFNEQPRELQSLTLGSALVKAVD